MTDIVLTYFCRDTQQNALRRGKRWPGAYVLRRVFNRITVGESK